MPYFMLARKTTSQPAVPWVWKRLHPRSFLWVRQREAVSTRRLSVLPHIEGDGRKTVTP